MFLNRKSLISGYLPGMNISASKSEHSFVTIELKEFYSFWPLTEYFLHFNVPLSLFFFPHQVFTSGDIKEEPLKNPLNHNIMVSTIIFTIIIQLCYRKDRFSWINSGRNLLSF